jgi:hypothetical protein
MFQCLLRSWVILSALPLLTAEATPEQRPASAQPTSDRVIAIDVLLLPDAKMVAKAEAANARLRENYPEGYTLGKEHVPHITLVQAYVREKDLPWIEAAVSKLADATQPHNWELTATGYAYAIWSGVGITSISIERSPRLEEFEVDVSKAVNRNAVANGTAAAFSTTRELPKIEPEIIEYVKNFDMNSTGTKFNPHVTIGVAHEDFVKRLKAEPFEKFSFKSAGIAIYQLGNFGTAQKKLWEWHAK